MEFAASPKRINALRQALADDGLKPPVAAHAASEVAAHGEDFDADPSEIRKREGLLRRQGWPPELSGHMAVESIEQEMD